MDKSPLKTLTLEDFLESERHKLTGTLTPVTPETFAKWKAERMDKKQAEEQAALAKEATGRAMFEKGGWDISDDEGEEDDMQDADDDAWNLEKLRKETEAILERKEADRIAKFGGAQPPANSVGDDTAGPAEPSEDGTDEVEEDVVKSNTDEAKDNEADT